MAVSKNRMKKMKLRALFKATEKWNALKQCAGEERKRAYGRA